MKRIYNYCECCMKPIDGEQKSDDNSLDICSSCAAELLMKIFGENAKD